MVATSVVIKRHAKPSWRGGFARSYNAVNLGLWKGLRFATFSELGITGEVTRDFALKNDGVFVGAPTWQVKRGNESLLFDGFVDRVSVSNHPSLEDFTALTLTAWVIPLETGPTSFARILSKQNGPTGDDYMLGWTNFDKIAFRIGTGSGITTLVGGLTNPLDGDWICFICTWDGDNMVVYVNAREDGTDNQTGTLLKTGNPLGLGGHIANIDRRFHGHVKGWMIHDRVLSSKERQLVSDDSLALVRFKPLVFPIPDAAPPTTDGAGMYHHLQNLGAY